MTRPIILLAWWLVAWTYGSTGLVWQPVIAGPFATVGACEKIKEKIKGYRGLQEAGCHSDGAGP
jgi:hypothetical protein